MLAHFSAAFITERRKIHQHGSLLLKQQQYDNEYVGGEYEEND